jgi:hypothetical protein
MHLCTHYNDKMYCRLHFNDKGERCHGRISEGEIVPWSPKCIYAPRITKLLRQNLEQLFRWGWTVPQVMDMHLKQQVQTGGPDCPFNNPNPLPWSIRGAKDDTFPIKLLHNIKDKVAKETYKASRNDQESAQIWINAHQHFVLLHQLYVIGPPTQDFMLVLQSKWQLGMMLHYSHNKPLALDSTFATTKYDVGFSVAYLTMFTLSYIVFLLSRICICVLTFLRGLCSFHFLP